MEKTINGIKFNIDINELNNLRVKYGVIISDEEIVKLINEEIQHIRNKNLDILLE